MKKSLLVIILLALGSWLSASPVSQESAKKIAVNFYKHYAIDKTDYTVADVIEWKKEEFKAFYIFIFKEGGYVIVSADDAVLPILGYSTEESFSKNNIPENAKQWYEQYSEQIKNIVDLKIDNTLTLKEWNRILQGQFYSSKFAVSPLCTTTWNQDYYYNALCPADVSGPGGHAYTGCVATAQAQIMKYWNYPPTGTSSHSYTDPNYGLLTANFGATTYNWSSMPNDVSSPNTAVATLMYHCGVSVNMIYGASASGAYSWNVPNALVSYFGYQNSAEIKYMAQFTNANWINMLKAELDASRPVYYAGYSSTSSGHAFVCDGYDNTNKFHFNWGWSGMSNGNYAIGNLNPGYNFNNGNEVIIRIRPASNAPIANFSASTITPPIGGSVNFTDASTNAPTSWLWTFDGGTPATSTQQNPQNITYATAGKYQVTLTVTNANGSDTKTWAQYINVGGTPSAWIKQNTGFTTSNRGIDQISIVNQYIVWAKAFDGGAPTNNIREFTRTVNGGTTWMPGIINFTNASNYDISNLFAINDTVCYACMFLTSANGGKIVKTTNGGNTWTEQNTATFTNSFANFVHFFNSNDGVAIGDPVNQSSDYVIYTTTNGGNTWTQVPGANIPNSSGAETAIVNFYDVVGNTIWFGTSKGRIYKSSNKGLNWTVVQTNVGADQSYPVFKDANTGFMVLAADPYTIKKTTDGGATWTTFNPTGYFVKYPLLDYIPGTTATWVNVSSGPNKGSSYSTDDCGSFQNIDTGSIQYTCVKFYDINTGWAGGFNTSATDGGIYKWDPSIIVGTNEYYSAVNQESINIYPNPVNDYLNIELFGIINKNVTVNIYDIIGHKVISNEFLLLGNNVLNLNLSGINKGIYMLTVDTGRNIITKKLSITD